MSERSAQRGGLRARLSNWGRPPRVIGIDVARGLAIVGMMAAHMAAVPELEWSEPSTWGGIVAGRSSLLFAFLAGVSLALVARNPRYHSDAGRARFRSELVGRALAVFAIGLICELMNTQIAIILTVYGALFLCVIPVVWLSTKRLIIVALAFTFLGPLVVQILRIVSLEASGSGLMLMLFNVYSLPVWFTFMVFGMIFGRLRIESIKVAASAIVMGTFFAVVGYSAGYLGDAWLTEYQIQIGKESKSEYEASKDTSSKEDSWDKSSAEDVSVTDEATYSDLVRESLRLTPLRAALVSSSPHSGGTLEIVGSGGFVVAVVGWCLLIARPLRWLILPIACAGSMPLTVYVVHVMSFMVLSKGPGQYFDNGSTEMWAWNAAAILVFATAWALTLGRGPLERLVSRSARAMAQGT
ncbi:MAG: DUF1624 domain-containing protein [Aeromicrobium sp.]|nr:MAG: DUF1624 domain-containing protein [Aeromicrobium sp.]